MPTPPSRRKGSGGEPTHGRPAGGRAGAAAVREGGIVTKKIDKLLAEEGQAAESFELGDELPANVKVSRPNLAKAAVVSVRLSADEHGRLQRAAEKANLPVSTLIRVWALDRVASEEQGGGATVAERLDRLERAVFQRST